MIPEVFQEQKGTDFLASSFSIHSLNSVLLILETESGPENGHVPVSTLTWTCLHLALHCSAQPELSALLLQWCTLAAVFSVKKSMQQRNNSLWNGLETHLQLPTAQRQDCLYRDYRDLRDFLCRQWPGQAAWSWALSAFRWMSPTCEGLTVLCGQVQV